MLKQPAVKALFQSVETTNIRQTMAYKLKDSRKSAMSSALTIHLLQFHFCLVVVVRDVNNVFLT